MYEGEIVEKGTRDHIINNPKHPYTKLLLSSNFSIYEDDIYNVEEFDDMYMESEENVSGCKLYNRCPFRAEICKENTPRLNEVQKGHFVACHLI